MPCYDYMSLTRLPLVSPLPLKKRIYLDSHEKPANWNRHEEAKEKLDEADYYQFYYESQPVGHREDWAPKHTGSLKVLQINYDEHQKFTLLTIEPA